MKLAETWTPPSVSPKIELTKLSGAIDEDLLLDMVKNSGARVCFHGSDVNSLLANNGHKQVFKSLKQLHEYEDIVNDSRQQKYSTKPTIDTDYFWVMNCFYRTHDQLLYAVISMGVTIHTSWAARPFALSTKCQLKFTSTDCYSMVSNVPPMVSQDIDLNKIIDQRFTEEPT